MSIISSYLLCPRSGLDHYFPDDAGEVLSWYRKLTDLRANTPVLIDGTYKELFGESGEIYAAE